MGLPMFKLLHTTLTVLANALGPIFRQLWTKDQVPSEVSLRHDFNDGAGSVPAAPVDEVGASSEVVSVEQKVTMAAARDNVGASSEVVGVEQKVTMAASMDNVGASSEIVSIEIITEDI